MEQTPAGLVPAGEGWFVLNAREAKWLDGHFGAYTRFEGASRFPKLGFNVAVLEPGQPACYYHGEDEQEDFLVLSGECLVLIEGQERPLQAVGLRALPGRGPSTCSSGPATGRARSSPSARRSGGDVVYPRSDARAASQSRGRDRDA